MHKHLTEKEIAQRLRQFKHVPYSELEKPAAEKPLRPAAVLVPLIWASDEWHVLYTRRADKVEHHKGQVAFPGGATDPEDTSPEDTALREAHEEIGLQPSDVRILGRMGEMVTISHFLVTPVVGVISWPYGFKVHTPEVARVFTMPLSWLATRENWMEFIRAETGHTIIAYFPFDSELLWGMTARITVNFVKALGLVIDKSADIGY
jgi:8-oxo-dGTP pyrophosphatase MutT (NUDIX family)